MTRLNRFGIAAALAMASALAFPQNAGGPATPEAQARLAIETRQGLFKVMASQYGPIARVVRNQAPFDASLVARNAARIQVLAELIPDLTALDTRPFKAVATSALDGIWNSQADFKSKSDALVSAAAGTVEAARTGDKAATLKAAAGIGKACGACHDDYRAKP